MRKQILCLLAIAVLSTTLVAGCAKQKGNARIVSERPGQETTRLYNHDDEDDEDDESETVEETTTSQPETETKKETEKKESRNKKNVITNDTVNVRKKPSTDSKVVKTLDAGVKLHRESKEGKWSVVIVDGKKRYVASEYLDEIKDDKNSTDNKDDKKPAVSTYIDEAGYSMDYFEGTGCKQLVVVDSKNSGATIRFFSKKNKQWVENEDLECAGYVGSEGTISPYEMSEEHRATPRGLYGIGQAFYIGEKPKTGLASFKITNKTYWVDDPDSSYYNQKVEGTQNKDWKSAEHMIDATEEYKCGFVIQYNTAGEYDRGSAIFFHISSGPTAGCVGTTESMVLKYLKKLDQTKSPLILVL